MRTAYWQAVRTAGYAVPAGGRLTDLTAELTAELGNPDPDARELALDVLLAWVAGGVYDGLLATLGDGMADGLDIGLGRDADWTVHRRVSCARLVAACVARDTAAPEVGRDRVLAWGDRLLAWLTRERDLRGHVAGQGRARAIAHGADALGVLACSPALGEAELVALLDVVADRLAEPTAYPLAESGDRERPTDAPGTPPPADPRGRSPVEAGRPGPGRGGGAATLEPVVPAGLTRR